MLFGTVGVAPGSYTIQIPTGGKAQLLGPACVDDVDGPYGYGLPSRHRYDAANSWFKCQFLTPMPMGCGVTSAGPTATVQDVMDPYGTDSYLKGARLADAMTFAGVRVDVLGLAAGAILGLGFLVHHFAKPKRRR